MTTVAGIVVLAIVFSVKYGGSAWSGISWLWSKMPAVKMPSLPALSTAKASSPTAAQAFAALETIARFKALGIDDPSHKLVLAALREVSA